MGSGDGWPPRPPANFGENPLDQMSKWANVHSAANGVKCPFVEAQKSFVSGSISCLLKRRTMQPPTDRKLDIRPFLFPLDSRADGIEPMCREVQVLSIPIEN